MADPNRQRKVEDQIHQTVARMLERRIKDPRLGFVTITDARVTGDLQHATIFYTVLGSKKEAENSRKALESAKGLIRSEVGRALGIRLTPSIEFQLDKLPETSMQFEDALERARQADAELANVKKDARYAGEEDPYKRREED